MSNILIFIVIWLIIFLILILYKGLSEISESLNDLYILYYEKLSDNYDIDFKER